MRLAILLMAFVSSTLIIDCKNPPRAALKGVDLEGREVDLLPSDSANLTVLVFVRTDCPISNRYAPELERIVDQYGERGVRLWLVYPIASETAEQIRAHQAEYHLPKNAVRDPSHALVRFASAKVTPEAAVISRAGELTYHGRIDDRFFAYGKERPEPTSHDLEGAIALSLSERPVPEPDVPAIGCQLPEVE